MLLLRRMVQLDLSRESLFIQLPLRRRIRGAEFREGREAVVVLEAGVGLRIELVIDECNGGGFKE